MGAEACLAQDEVNDFAMRRILRMAVKVQTRVDLVLAATDAALTGKIVRRAGPPGNRSGFVIGVSIRATQHSPG